MGYLGVYIDPSKKPFDRLDYVHERIVVGFYPVFCLRHLGVTRVRTWEVKNTRTRSRIARPACNAFSGENVCQKPSVRDVENAISGFFF